MCVAEIPYTYLSLNVGVKLEGATTGLVPGQRGHRDQKERKRTAATACGSLEFFIFPPLHLCKSRGFVVDDIGKWTGQ